MIQSNSLRRQFLLFLFIMATARMHSQSVSIAIPDGRRIGTATVDSIARKLMDTAGVTGMLIGLISDNQPAYTQAYGYRNKGRLAMNDTATSFYAASLAKALFATLVMQLLDQGLIDLDKPLYHYLPKPLPEYDNYKDLAGDERWKLITARHCLEHSTGFPNWRELNPTGSKKLQIFFTPGTQYAYSGEGIYLLQFVVEIITGRPLEELARKQIFEPYGMINTSYIWQASFEKNYAVGHSRDEDTFTVRKRNSANAAGSMQTTIADYTRFLSCIMQGKGISEKSRQEMIAPQIKITTSHQFPTLRIDTTDANKSIQLAYALGWGVFQSELGHAFFKEGHSDDGWEHYAISFPDKKSALIIMTNSLNGESIFKELVEKLCAVKIPWQWEGYTPYRPTVKLPEDILGRYAGSYEGRFKAQILLENGVLKAISQDAGLPKTNLYFSAPTRFFMKRMDLAGEFADDLNGRPQSLKVNDEGELYTLTRVPDSVTNYQPSKTILNTYLGKYAFESDPKRILSIEWYNNELIAKTKGQPPMLLLFDSDTSFRVKSVLDIKGQFVSENGTVTQLIIQQNGQFKWVRIP